jgi:hypothetical protein
MNILEGLCRSCVYKTFDNGNAIDRFIDFKPAEKESKQSVGVGIGWFWSGGER